MRQSMGRGIAVVACVVAALVAGSAHAVSAQGMSASELTRLEQSVDQLASDIAALRQRDRALARSLEGELQAIEEEVIYLKVKQRREGAVPRATYLEIRDRVEALSARVRGDEPAQARSGAGGVDTRRGAPRTTAPGVIPAGTEIDVRLADRLSSDTAEIEDRFEATTAVDLRQNGRIVIPAGSLVRGVVTDVRNAGRLERKGELHLSFDSITVNGRQYPIRATVVEALEAGGYREDAGKIGTGAAVGAIIGGILGGVRGALTGVLIGGGGVVAATEGQDVQLPPGTILRMRLEQDLNVSSSLK